jgi:hypothetical protein
MLPATHTDNHLQVWDRDYLKPDDLLGFVDLPVKAILTWTQGACCCCHSHVFTNLLRAGVGP